MSSGPFYERHTIQLQVIAFRCFKHLIRQFLLYFYVLTTILCRPIMHYVYLYKFLQLYSVSCSNKDDECFVMIL